MTNPANDSSIMSSFARCDSGMESVGLNAMEFDLQQRFLRHVVNDEDIVRKFKAKAVTVSQKITRTE